MVEPISLVFRLHISVGYTMVVDASKIGLLATEGSIVNNKSRPLKSEFTASPWGKVS